MTTRARAWVFTVNNYVDADEHVAFAAVLERGAKYISVGREVGENGTPHLQGYIYFTNPTRMSTLKKMWPTGHFEVALSLDGAIAYTQKEGDFFEDGVKPLSQDEKGACGKRSAEERWQLAQTGAFEKLAPECYRTYKMIRMEYLGRSVKRLENLHNIWVVGKAGFGKSRFVWDHFGDLNYHYHKSVDQWWCGYEFQKVVHYEEVSPKFITEHGNEFKMWTDRYPFKASIKGGHAFIRPLMSIVTSQYTIEECCSSPQDYEAIKRRFFVIDINADGTHSELPEWFDLYKYNPSEF